ncbi:unnamed protein product (macronuclear) [Paramecium tetraurelia]|uniref:Replication factor A C-terminal domain-containing protein n=1 Tax=Paramecium tetraurelia TaxID=5888 RepID=A0C9Y4_PARTE|nr:uncharacterized protein GSPATT00006908001 [Paramecium tetraurelia]CAK67601.1 unnamed protein product [Paramecium tetraurelia]|eukprot:XP_001434998.1 hypothetical protein (macronuclear) [Paramecium tetraurelia strain d4-2]
MQIYRLIFLEEQGSDDVKSMVLLLVKWKLSFLEKYQSYVVVILECEFLGYKDISLDLSTFNPDVHLSETKKIKYTILKTNLNKPPQQVEPQPLKKVKIENFVFSKPIENSIIFDENLINQSITMNKSYLKYFQDQQTISELLVNKKKSWVLEGRIVDKSDMLEFKKKNSNVLSQYFKIIILDREQGIIPGLFYDKSNLKMFPILEKGKVYLFKNGSVSKDNSNYPKSITFTQFSIIQESENDDLPKIPMISPKKIYDLQGQPIDSIVDLVVVIQEIKTLSDVCRQLTVLDQTGRIVIKLMGKQYVTQIFKKGEIIICKGLTYKTQQNFAYLTSNYNTIILNDQDYNNEVKSLRDWLQEKDIDHIMKPSKNCLKVNLEQLEECVLKKLNEGKSKNNEQMIVIGYLTGMSIFTYPRCPSNRCHSKMEKVPQRDTYRCKKCYVENNSPQMSFIMNVTIMDEHTKIEATVFDDYAVKLLGLSADEYQKLTEQEQRMILYISKFRQQQIKLQVLFNDYNGSIRPQYKVVEITDIDYKELADEEMKNFEELDYLLNVSQII